MLVRPPILVVACMLLAAVASAEDNCGSMLRTMKRFRGTVRSVEPAVSSDVSFQPVDLDVRFVVAIDTEAGERMAFGIHSPSHTFGPDPVVGRTLDFEAERMECDGKFRRFLSLGMQPRRPTIERIGGWLEVGHTYRAAARWEGDGLTITEPLQMPMHHDVGINFSNIEDFPREQNRHLREIVFEVTAVHIQQVAEMQWDSTYDLRIIRAR